MLNLKVRDHDFYPINSNGSTSCRRCGTQTTAAVLAWGGVGLDDCPGVMPVEIVLEDTDKCECGSFKTYGIGKGKPGHSPWCPWSAK